MVYKTIYLVNTKVNPSVVLQTVTVSYGFPLQSKTFTHESSAGGTTKEKEILILPLIARLS